MPQPHVPMQHEEPVALCLGAQHSVNTAAAAPTAEKLLLLRVNVPRLRTPASLLRPRGGKPTSAAASSVILAARDGSRLMP